VLYSARPQLPCSAGLRRTTTGNRVTLGRDTLNRLLSTRLALVIFLFGAHASELPAQTPPGRSAAAGINAGLYGLGLDVSVSITDRLLLTARTEGLSFGAETFHGLGARANLNSSDIMLYAESAVGRQHCLQGSRLGSELGCRSRWGWAGSAGVGAEMVLDQSRSWSVAATAGLRVAEEPTRSLIHGSAGVRLVLARW
jgi:hypothetical protein